MKKLKIDKIDDVKIKSLLEQYDDLNIETPYGFITLVGGLKQGILSKVEFGKEYIFIAKLKRWVEV